MNLLSLPFGLFLENPFHDTVNSNSGWEGKPNDDVVEIFLAAMRAS